MTEDDMWDLLLHEGYPYTSPPAVRQAWMDAFMHVETIAWIWRGFDSYWGLWKGHQLTVGERPAGWLGHRDLCPSQWGEPCDCADPLPAVPCVCRYYRAVSGFSHIQTEGGNLFPMYGLDGISWFAINPRCHHHGIQPDPRHDDIPNPYDLDHHERTDHDG